MELNTERRFEEDVEEYMKLKTEFPRCGGKVDMYL